jgi:hypothetical protein
MSDITRSSFVPGMANRAFELGLMRGIEGEYGDYDRKLFYALADILVNIVQ